MRQLENTLTIILIYTSVSWLISEELYLLVFFSPDVDFTRKSTGDMQEGKTSCVSAAVSDESVAGDSGVYEACIKPPCEDAAFIEDYPVLSVAEVLLTLRYDPGNSSFVIIIGETRNHPPRVQYCSRVYIRVAILPSSNDISCLFRTKVHPATESILFNELFRVSVSQSVLQQKTLRVDVCSAGRSHQEECLAGIQINLADLSFTNEEYTRWHTLMPCRSVHHPKETVEKSVLDKMRPVDLDL
ncbi:unnamed protein product, partial [Ranitomeya imitator]